MEVADAEAEAALEALKAALEHTPPDSTNLGCASIMEAWSKESTPKRIGSARHNRPPTRSGSDCVAGRSTAMDERRGFQGTRAYREMKGQTSWRKRVRS